jgi:FkbM family methyltransferase
METKVREAKVDIGGTEYVITSDDNYLDQIGNPFEPHMVKLFKTLATNSRVIFDIGANIGCTALLFAELADKVYAFEPSPTTFGFLEKNILAAGRKNVFPQNIGLGMEPGEFELTFAPSNRAGGFVSDKTKVSPGHITERIVIRTLDEVVRSSNAPTIDFIKIDVEGFEGHVLRGGQHTLSSHRPTVVLELNHWCLNAFQRTSIPDFFDFLRSIFPILYAIDGSNYMDLHDEGENYTVMYHHLVQFRFPNIVAAFDETRLRSFRAAFEHGLNIR